MAKYNKNFGKLNEGGELEFAPLPLIVDGQNIWTNIPETYLKCGYYPIERTEQPGKDGFYYTDFWAVENNKCVQKWEEHEVSVPIEVATEEEIKAAIKEGVDSIDS